MYTICQLNRIHRRKTFDGYAASIAYFDRNIYLPNGHYFLCYEVDLRSLKLHNVVSSTMILDNRLCCNPLRRWNMRDYPCSCLWGIDSGGSGNLQSLDITIIQNAGRMLPTLHDNRGPSIKQLKVMVCFLCLIVLYQTCTAHLSAATN